MKMTVIPIVISPLGGVTKDLEKKSEVIGNQGKNKIILEYVPKNSPLAWM